MHERKAMMERLADGFVTLPGALGTLEETCEMLTWAQLGLHAKPCGVLNVDGYYDAFLALLDRAVVEGFMHPEYRAMVQVADAPDALFEAMIRFRPPVLEKWISRSET